MNEEMKLPSGGGEDVSVQEQIVAAQAPADYIKPCVKCGANVINPQGNTKFCDECRQSRQSAPKKKSGRKPITGKWSGVQKGTEEFKRLDREEHQRLRDTRKTQAQADAKLVHSSVELTRKEIKQILIEDRNLRPMVAEQFAPLVLVASRAHQIPANYFLVRYGLKNTLDAVRGIEWELPSAAQEIIDGEILYSNELAVAFEFSMYRQPEVSYEQFLELRRKFKTDCMFAGKLLEKDFHDSPHGNWTRFFPQFSPDGLVPNYTQQQAKEWLSRQTSSFRTFLLLASRNSYKSTFSKVWVLTFVASYPDARVLLVSETHELSKSFIGELRGFLEVLDEAEPTKFQQLFPELTIPAGEGTGQTYENPIRHLRLPAPSLRQASADSSTVGSRADLCLCDDILSDQSCGNETQTKATVARFDSLNKLLEVNGIAAVLGTPWSETPPDLYKTLIDRADADPETTISVRIDPIMEIRPQARGKKLTDLVETDIESFLFPERLNWKFIRQEVMKNPRDTSFFESQNLCRFVPPIESQWKCNFDENILRALVHMQHTYASMQCLRTILSVDTSHGSISRYADASAIVTSKLLRDPNSGKNLFVVWDVDADKYRPAEIAAHIVEAAKKHAPDTIVIERPPLWEALATLILQEGQRRSAVIPAHKIYWCPPTTNSVKSKAQRIKMLEPLCANATLQFLYSPDWNEITINEFVSFDGVHRSTGTRKEDRVDAISRGVERVLSQLLQVPQPQKSKAEFEEEAAEMGRQMLAAQHAYYFGTSELPQSRQSEPEPPSATSRYWGPLVRR